MPRPSWRTALTNGIVVSGILLLGETNRTAQSQPVADDTLGNERSVVVPLGTSTQGDRIDGGARRGDNLFHSFQEFGVDTGRSVYFSDPGVNNIITRVTSGTRSQIDGVLGVLGNANLFLINPSGIIFGTNARLDVGGSFTATTADAIEFNKQGSFSAINPTAVPLLTVQPSAFVFNQINPVPIANNSIAAAQLNRSGLPGFGLRVPQGENLTLLGGNISMDGGGVNALMGRVEIGGLSQPGTVALNADGSLSFPTGVARADVSLTNQSSIDVAADGGGINITTGSLSLTNGAKLITRTLGEDNAGDVNIDASESVSLDASYVFSDIRSINANEVTNAGNINILTGSLSLTNGTQLITSTFYSQGNAGNINILTDSLSLTNGTQLITSTFYSQGNAGNVNIYALEYVSLDGGSFISSAVIGQTFVGGNAGNINILAGSFSLTNGAQLIASTLGQGDAGSVIIYAIDRVSLEGVSQEGFSSGIFTTTREEAEGKGGNVYIEADSVSITDGAVVSTETFNRFRGGSVTLNADTLEVMAGGQVITATSSSGEAGNITLNIADRITLSGSDPSNIPITGQAASGLYANTTPNSSGIGGTVRINTSNLEVFDGATIAVSSEGEGRAGDIEITANRVQLNDSSSLSAETATVDGGNIKLSNVELLQLGNSSLISTTAGTARAGGNGGNIDIDSELIVAFQSENSDIRANAFTGSGGNVRIDTQGLFGIAFQAQDNLLTSDITASSEQGLQGNVNITLPEIDPRRDLTQLPQEVVDVSSRIAQGCRGSNGARQNRGEFIVKGRGGLPPSPTDLLVGDESLATWVTLEQTSGQATSANALPAPKSKTAAAPIVEAQAWIVDEKGKVTLIANAFNSAAQTNLICQKQKNK